MREPRTRGAAARIRNLFRGGTSRSVMLVCVTALIVSAASATAASLITGKQIKDGTITSRDIKKGGIAMNRLSSGVQTQIKQGLTLPSPTIGGQNTPGNQGENGQNGAPGAKGDKGDQGNQGDKGDKGDNGSNGSNGSNGIDAGSIGPHWGMVDRNIIGAAHADLRNGPFNADGSGPPLGNGSLNLLVASGTDKIAWGDELDYNGDAFADLDQVGFRVFETGEDITDNVSPAGTTNMPSIAIEINPHGAGGSTSTFSTAVWSPSSNTTPNTWSGYLDATSTGDWGLTGSQFAGNSSRCGINVHHCTFDELQTFLATGSGADILTVQITKGRDHAWQGAVDGLRINNDVMDFETSGTNVRTP